MRRAALGAGLLLLAALPLLGAGSLVLGLLAQVAAVAVVCLGLALLMGQAGLYSFGQAVYAGLGGYAVLHALNAFGPLPAPVVALLPLLGAAAGASAAALLGALATRQGGLAFAMITLGLGELVHALAPLLPAVFGGETGVRADRTALPWGGLDFGAAGQVYALTLTWAALALAFCAALPHTPFGRALAAVREQPQRAAGLGHAVMPLRWLAFTLAGALAGLGGALLALQFETVTAEAMSSHRSGLLLLFTFVGGAAGLAGPVLGAALLVLGTVWISAWTPAWGLYVGLLFLVVVMAAPQGLAAWHWRRPQWRDAAWLPLGAGGLLLVELVYHRQLDDALGPVLKRGPLVLDTAQPAPWLAALALLALGAAGVWLRKAAR